MTSSQINDTFLFHRVLKILTGGRILLISIAWCQIEGEIHSFPTMYGKGWVGRCGQNGEIKVSVFLGHKAGSSDFGGVWTPNVFRCRNFRDYPSKKWGILVKMSYGHVR